MTAANVLSAAEAMSSGQRASFAVALGFPAYATLALANAALPQGRPYYNTTDNVYDTTTA